MGTLFNGLTIVLGQWSGGRPLVLVGREIPSVTPLVRSSGRIKHAN